MPWETARSAENLLTPGPVGEYVEVVDVDPASARVYDPVDLNNPYLLAQDGLSPSEGNPQFHQQMVYAVAFGSRRSVPFLKGVPNRRIGMRPEVRMAVRIDPFPAPSFKSADQEAARQNQDQFG